MAQFEGTLQEFIDFIGPMTRNTVSNLSRKFKKNTTCRHEGCNKRKPLEAAHVKGKERPKIIADLLANYREDNDLYIVDLAAFKNDFITAHTPIEDVILPMCKEHHLAYDKIQKIDVEYPIMLDQFDTEDGIEIYTEKELEQLEDEEVKNIENAIGESLVSTIKLEVKERYGIENKQIAFSKVSEANGLWNFDVNKSKFNHKFYFVFYNQVTENYKVAIVQPNTFDLKILPEKNKNAVRFLVDEKYVDKSGIDFKMYFE